MLPDTSRFLTFLFKIRWFLGFLFVLGLVMSVDILFLHILLPLKRKNLKPTFDLPPNAAISSPLADEVKSIKNGLSSLKNCMSESPFGANSTETPQIFLEKALTHSLLKKNHITNEGYTIEEGNNTADLIIRYPEPEAGEQAVIHLYQNGPNGKREPKDLEEPPEKYLQGKKVIGTYTEAKAQFHNGWNLNYFLKNKKMSSFVLKMGPKVLACNGADCFCK